ncbi:Tyrosine-protein phosphatase cdcA [Penicillium taxi]|uniref:Tyrosine-protein phosphatase cdcA n=1 Tax=Penicillium taxi TaxID=168475 RepID=UPI002545B780|nr:Tyrosine-protein phosphatase cdcA [Penicillium taxi]KAJ5887891.1 Tyrosine-protein phosphatase cdcA [Penicillium taxi]
MSSDAGQMIEYIQDRLYLASYDSTPSSRTPFPFAQDIPKSPSKRSARPTMTSHSKRRSPVYFTVDDTLLYNAFHADFGPLHIGHLYRFAVLFHEILGDSANSERPVVFYSKTDARSRANAACLVACYMVLIQSWPPHLALAPIAQADPPYMPFRDAGYSQADFILNIQDVVYGVWKAKEQGLCGLRDFNLEEYEKFERVDMGDFNWVTQNFLAFASPQHQPVAPIPMNTPEYDALPSSISEICSSKLPLAFKNVLVHFKSRNVGLVVRLNSELYSPSYFTAMGIQHIDMIFEDGTCPPLQLVRKFIKLAHDMITIKNKGIAVHCKAGLGRTGCLIGAYLIYRYGFTANEVISFMRFMRPGMVVGPQQHWLHLNQGSFREWWFEDSMREKLAQAAPVTPARHSTKKRSSNGPISTPPNNSHSKRAALGEIDNNTDTHANQHEENLPAPTPGQPRKSHRKDSRHHPYARTASGGLAVDHDAKNGEQRSQRGHRLSNDSSESEEEAQLRMLAKRSSKSPAAASTTRSVSYSATVTASYTLTDDANEDQENWVEHAGPKTPSSRKNTSTPIPVTKVRSSPRRATTDSKKVEPRGVRKTSARVGSTSSPARAIRAGQ